MSTLLGNQALKADDTTMVIYRSSRKPIDPERKRDLAKRCGVNFIRLIYKHSLTSAVGVSGFQHVKLRSQPRKGGGVEPVAQWHQNIYTNQPMAEGSMDFVPDEMYTGYAYLPDSPFNRVRLAYAEIAGNAVWTIDDQQIYREICELANEIRESVSHKMAEEELRQKQIEVDLRVKQNNVATGIEHKTKVEIEVGVLEDQVKMLELEGKKAELKRRLAELQGKLPMLAAETEVVKSTVPEKEPEVDARQEEEFNDLLADMQEAQGNEEEDDFRADQIRRQAKAEIHHKNKELINEIKKNYLQQTGKNRGWAFSTEYREKIAPLVKARVQELMNEHATAGIAT